MAALGCALLSGKSAQIVADGLSESSFTEPAHQITFRVVKDLVEQYTNPALDVVAEELRRAGKLGDAGGEDYLVQLCDTPESVLQTRFYVEQVKKAEDCRTLLERAKGVAVACKEGDRSKAVELADTMLAGMYGVGQTVFRPDELTEFLRKRASGGVPSGFQIVTESLLHHHGYPKGELSLIGANTGKGKSILGVQEWQAACMKNQRVYIATLEMDGRSLMSRFMRMLTGFSDYHEADFRGCSQEYLGGEDLVLKMDFEVFDPSAHFGSKRTVEELCERVMAAHDKKPIDEVIVDYGQLLDTSAVKGEVFTKQDYIAQRLVRLAKDTGAAVIALVQIKPDATGEPQIRGSRAWKDHAAFVLYRLDKKKKDEDARMFLKVDKNRFGKTMEREVEFDTSRVMFKEVL